VWFSVRTILYVDPFHPDLEEAVARISPLNPSERVGMGPVGVLLMRDLDGYGIRFDEYLDASPIPWPVVKVKIESSFAGGVIPGLYRRRHASAQAESYFEHGNNVGAVIVRGDNLAYANRLYNDIRNRRTKPTTTWMP
jgi:hypothetical protein